MMVLQTAEEQNMETSACNTITHNSVTAIKQEPNCSNDDTHIINAVRQGPSIRVVRFQNILIKLSLLKG